MGKARLVKLAATRLEITMLLSGRYLELTFLANVMRLGIIY